MKFPVLASVVVGSIFLALVVVDRNDQSLSLKEETVHLIDKLIVKLTGGMPAKEAPGDLLSAYEKVKNHLAGFEVYLEQKDGGYLLMEAESIEHQLQEAIAITVFYGDSTLPIWEGEPHVKSLREKLAPLLNTPPSVLISRDFQTRTGYYVSITRD